jgi:hypothetical protein
MILSRIIGPCPVCKEASSFGNLNISDRLLTRGCKACGITRHLPLPKLSKVILYLDQFFFSHAFRDTASDFAAAISLMSHLAHHQLLVIPFSPIHKTETHQWPSKNRDELWEFIRTTSRGHEFLPVYQAKHNQLRRSYRSFLEKGPVVVPIKRSDVFYENVDEWEDYFWIDVRLERENAETIRASKKKTLDDLLNLFNSWRGQPSNFEDDLKAEFQGAADSYFNFFSQLLTKVGLGDPAAINNSPVDAMIIEEMILGSNTITDPLERIASAKAFFASNYFRNVPYERISNGLLAVLKHRVKMGQYINAEKAREALSGFAFDLEFISGYLPYCHAMFMDQAMFEMANDSRLLIEKTYGTKLFSRSNWEDFLDYLASIEKALSADIQRALNWIYPEDSNGAKA